MVRTRATVIDDAARGAEEGFTDSLDEVKRLNALLVDNAELRSNSSQWDVLIDEIRRTVYEPENVIDKFLVQSKLNQENVLKKLFKVKKNFAAKINKILEDVKKIREDHKQLFEPCSPVISSDHHPENIVQETQGPSLENNEVVGFDEEAKKVIERLVEGSECLDVIPVVGMPGLGKTTLARKIYNDPKIPDEFFNCIWVFVAEEICDRVDKSGDKCLIVLDDVWDSDIVDFVKTVFPENNRGHRIMATTRHVHVARAVNADPHNETNTILQQ
nr:putative disease resistance protein At1g50180 [Nicotiana tomentosiformis]